MSRLVVVTVHTCSWDWFVVVCITVGHLQWGGHSEQSGEDTSLDTSFSLCVSVDSPFGLCRSCSCNAGFSQIETVIRVTLWSITTWAYIICEEHNQQIHVCTCTIGIGRNASYAVGGFALHLGLFFREMWFTDCSYMYTHVIVPCRNWRLFRCIFRLHRCVWSTVLQKFC